MLIVFIGNYTSHSDIVKGGYMVFTLSKILTKRGVCQ